jgi:quinol monooxygenase YgiN
LPLLRTLGVLAIVSIAGPARAAASETPGGYVVVVDYVADAAHFQSLKDLVIAVARASIEEPGCRRFDIVAPTGGPANHLTLYEVFDDADAFAAHAASPPFKRFAADSAAVGARRTVMPGSLVLSLRKP